MAITKIVQGNGDGAPKNIGARIGWFVVIWTLSTAVFFAGASLLHLIIPK
ncbi:DUF2474 family protein [Acetobacter pasteurianus]|uniref:DUF2474 domain-containing protein n=2 Tax=Acetobacter pasteurianus TaxID=438 RepID=A0AAC9SNY5_ACEPA|nr:DUF2474 family protein [Acetobacter pasteurianus]ASC06193.1 hypothetical protein S101468_01959 [Acetobacter pasteurianus subsp. pasteurianus]GCD59406.1 hypothetical protein NBRC3277_1981 [Acetobacter pasteurianus NBRC 3277]GCD62911.1 hypothetical protein NBRC3278_2004 [Acetobacter pasteurianus NBRC 3278]GCD66541.1 hypothetical protein NBRC3279_2032 [Acetobacter pasteurianus NBRC 3279]GCD69284.1 hypothetical protein NBRC3280_1919 [Acetobacter pasteurianus NBRC 3280]